MGEEKEQLIREAINNGISSKSIYDTLNRMFGSGDLEKYSKRQIELAINNICDMKMNIPSGINQNYSSELVRNNYLLIAICLAVMGIIIKYADKLSKDNRSFKDMGFKDAILIGCAQVCALIPGFSRSGTTISMARALKINRSDAAKFSFYLSAPVVLGAVAIKVLKGDMLNLITGATGTFIIGVVVSFVFGLLCIKFLLTYIKKHNYDIFMWYRLALALIVLIVLYLK